METQAAILAARPLPYGRAELVEWNWPARLDVTVRESRHMIEMSLPPDAADGIAAFPDVDPERFRFMGSLFVRPADVYVHARSIGGRIRVVRLAVDPDAGGAADALALDGQSLADGLDLREAAPRSLLSRIRTELMHPQRDSDQLVRAYADALLIETARVLATRRNRSRDTARLAGWQFAKVVARIEREGAPATTAELADLCGLSPRHFSRLYRALTGETVSQSLDRARTRRAMALLRDETLSVKTVASRLGFAQDGAFSTAFRRSTGLSPRQWRQRWRIRRDDE